MMMQRGYFFQKSNKWDAARDVLQSESRQIALQGHEREKRKYDKQNKDYWEGGIVASRKKRHRSQVNAMDEEPGPSDELPEQEEDLGKLNVSQLKERIKSRNIQVKGLTKLKKKELIELLKNAPVAMIPRHPLTF